MNANMKFLWYTIYNENTSSFHKYWQNKNKPPKSTTSFSALHKTKQHTLCINPSIQINKNSRKDLEVEFRDGTSLTENISSIPWSTRRFPQVLLRVWRALHCRKSFQNFFVKSSSVLTELDSEAKAFGREWPRASQYSLVVQGCA